MDPATFVNMATTFEANEQALFDAEVAQVKDWFKVSHQSSWYSMSTKYST